jgi:hypothetical protein
MPTPNFTAQLAHLQDQLAANEAWFRAHPDQQAAFQERRNHSQRQITQVQRHQAAAAPAAPAVPNAPAPWVGAPGNLLARPEPTIGGPLLTRPTPTGAPFTGFTPPPTPPTVPTAAELAATAQAEAAAREHAARDAWDRLNNQGTYDADGWQSMGFQPDVIPMPAGWSANNWLPPTPPVTPPVTPPTPPVTPPVIPLTPPVTPSAPGDLLGGHQPTGPSFTGFGPPPGDLLGGHQPTGSSFTGFAPVSHTNTLAQLFGPTGATATRASAQPWTQPAQNPFSGQQPDPGAWGQSTQPQQSNSAFGAPNQGLQSWNAPKRKTSANVWGSQPAGTWGSGSR